MIIFEKILIKILKKRRLNMNTGFIKVSAVSPRVTVANVEKNLQNALKTVKAESESGSSLIVLSLIHI